VAGSTTAAACDSSGPAPKVPTAITTSRWCLSSATTTTFPCLEARPSASSQPFAGQIDHLAQLPLQGAQSKAQIRPNGPHRFWRKTATGRSALSWARSRPCLLSVSFFFFSSFLEPRFGLQAATGSDPIGLAPIGLEIQRVEAVHRQSWDPNMVFDCCARPCGEDWSLGQAISPHPAACSSLLAPFLPWFRTDPPYATDSPNIQLAGVVLWAFPLLLGGLALKSSELCRRDPSDQTAEFRAPAASNLRANRSAPCQGRDPVWALWPEGFTLESFAGALKLLERTISAARTPERARTGRNMVAYGLGLRFRSHGGCRIEQLGKQAGSGWPFFRTWVC